MIYIVTDPTGVEDHEVNVTPALAARLRQHGMTVKPAPVTGHYECEDCGHQQTSGIARAEVVITGKNIEIVGGVTGSNADHCLLCDSAVRMLGVEVGSTLYGVTA